MSADITFQLGTKFSYRRSRDQPWVNATVYAIDASTNRLHAELDRSANMWPWLILDMSDPDFWDQIGTPF